MRRRAEAIRAIALAHRYHWSRLGSAEGDRACSPAQENTFRADAVVKAMDALLGRKTGGTPCLFGETKTIHERMTNPPRGNGSKKCKTRLTTSTTVRNGTRTSELRVLHVAIHDKVREIRREARLLEDVICDATSGRLVVAPVVMSFPLGGRWRGDHFYPDAVPWWDGVVVCWLRADVPLRRESAAYTHKRREQPAAVIHTSDARLDVPGSWASGGLLHETWHLLEAVAGEACSPWSNHRGMSSIECFEAFGEGEG